LQTNAEHNGAFRVPVNVKVIMSVLQSVIQSRAVFQICLCGDSAAASLQSWSFRLLQGAKRETLHLQI
jgi:hypothetical protein